MPPLTLPFRFRAPDTKAPEEAESHCSLLLCGLETSVALASSFKWKSHRGPDGHVHEEAMLDCPQAPGSSACPITLFRYSAPTAQHRVAISESLSVCLSVFAGLN